MTYLLLYDDFQGSEYYREKLWECIEYEIKKGFIKCDVIRKVEGILLEGRPEDIIMAALWIGYDQAQLEEGR